ncbi:MAG: cytochrome c oxidase subunit 3 [Bacteroidota bacterium]
MSGEAKHKAVKESPKSTIERLESLHPYEMLLYLAILASSLIFMFMIIAFSIRNLAGTQEVPYSLPKAFTFSTIILLLSNFRIGQLVKNFEQENLSEITRSLQISLLMSLSFIITQVFGWYKLYEQNLTISDDLSIAYLYVISGLHLFHVVGGLIYLVYCNFKCLSASGDGVKELVFFTNKFERMKLKLLNTYWTFLDISWLIIFFWFFFLF